MGADIPQKLRGKTIGRAFERGIKWLKHGIHKGIRINRRIMIFNK